MIMNERRKNCFFLLFSEFPLIVWFCVNLHDGSFSSTSHNQSPYASSEEVEKLRTIYLRGTFELLFFVFLVRIELRPCVFLWFRLLLRHCLFMLFNLQSDACNGVISVTMWSIVVCVKSRVGCLQAQQGQQVRVQSRSSNRIYALIQSKRSSANSFPTANFLCPMVFGGLFAWHTVVNLQERAP